MRNTLGFRFENAHCLGSEDEFSLELVQLVSLLLNVLVNSPMDADSGVSCICQVGTLFVEDTFLTAAIQFILFIDKSL